MPRNYAKRFADLIAADPDVASDYAIQLYDIEFAKAVAEELKMMGFEPQVNVTGLLTLHVPDDHPIAKEKKKTTRSLNWPRKPEDRNTQWSIPSLRLAV